jgi:hypothetical protein
MALGSTQPLRGIRTRYLPGGVKGSRPARKADNLTTVCEPVAWKMPEARRLTTLWFATDCYRDSFVLCLRAWRIFESRRKRTEGERGRVKEKFICTEESLSNIIIEIKPSKVAYVRYVARVGQVRNAYRIVV